MAYRLATLNQGQTGRVCFVGNGYSKAVRDCFQFVQNLAGGEVGKTAAVRQTPALTVVPVL